MDLTEQPDAATTLSWSGLTHRGRVRSNNEDTFLAIAFDARELRYLGKTGEASFEGGDFLFAVSDGMGGAKAGEFASRITVDRVTRLLPKAYRMSAVGLATGFADVFLELFTDIHEDLLRLGRSYEECAGMGATLSLCWFTPGWMYFGHIGDSRIYYLPKTGNMVQVSHDHSHVGWLRRQNRIGEREARDHPQRHALQQALGAGHQCIDPQVGAVGYRAGDRFVLCSDGLTEGLWDRQIEETVRGSAGPLAAPLLVEQAVAASGRDNTTVLVIEAATPSGGRANG